MPILDIQRREPSLPKLGNIRLGEMKEKEVTKDGKKKIVRYPVELDHFKLADAPDLLADYGPRPRTLYVYFAHATVDENLIAYHELWSQGGLMCRGDGEIVLRLINPNNGEVTARDGKLLTDYKTETQAYQEGDVLPCPGLAHDLYPRCQKCRPSCLLKVMVRRMDSSSLANDRLGYYQIRTGSIINIAELTGQLKFVEQMAGLMGRDLRGVPCILQRVKRTVPFTNDEGKRAQTDKWFLSIEVDTRWVQVAAPALQAHALSLPVPQIDLTAVNHEDSDSVDGEFERVPFDLDEGVNADLIEELKGLRDELPDNQAMAMALLEGYVDTAFDPDSFLVAVKQRLQLGRTDPMPFGQAVWAAMIDEMIGMLKAA